MFSGSLQPPLDHGREQRPGSTVLGRGLPEEGADLRVLAVEALVEPGPFRGPRRGRVDEELEPLR